MLRQLMPLLLVPMLSFCSVEKDDQRSESEGAPLAAGTAEARGAQARPDRTRQFGSLSATCSVQGTVTRVTISNRTSSSISLNGTIDFYYYDDFNNSRGENSQSISRTIYPGNRIEFNGPTPPSSATQCDVDLNDALPHPAAPLALSASNVDYHEMTLHWQSGGGDTQRFYVVASVTPSYNYSCDSGIAADTNTSLHLTGLDEGRFYYLRVCSENSFGLRSSSVELRVATKAHPAPNPVGLVLTADGLDRIKAEWQSGGGTTFYYRAQIAQGAAAPAEGCPNGSVIDTPKKVFVGLQPNTQYTIRICAANINDLVTSGITLSATTQDAGALSLPFVEEFGGSGRSTLGAAWTVASGNFAVSSGLVVSGSSTGVALLNTADDASNVRVGLVLNDQPKKCACSFGLVARAQDAGNMYLGNLRQQKNKNYAEIILRHGGTNVVLRSLKIKKYKDGSKLELRATGSTLQFLIEGKVVLTVVDSTFLGGKVGFYTSGAGQKADNFFANED